MSNRFNIPIPPAAPIIKEDWELCMEQIAADIISAIARGERKIGYGFTAPIHFLNVINEHKNHISERSNYGDGDGWSNIRAELAKISQRYKLQFHEIQFAGTWGGIMEISW